MKDIAEMWRDARKFVLWPCFLWLTYLALPITHKLALDK